MSDKMKIKAFAELVGVSVRTLQYYDEVGLLKPAYINEKNHRFYDSHSFTNIFIILSLKKLGMNLDEIQKYLNDSNMNIQDFIEEEKQRTQIEIERLQLRMKQLSMIDSQLKENPNIDPTFLPLFSYVTNNNEDYRLPIDKLTYHKKKQGNFNLVEWNDFIKELNVCFNRNLSIQNKRAIQCIKYWMKMLKENQVVDEMTNIAEHFYQKNPDKAMGLTKDTYRYLMNLIKEYEQKENDFI